VSGRAGAPRRFLIDAHVHVHDGFDVPRFYESALRNLERAAEGLDVATAWTGCLVLTETGAQREFRRLREGVGASDPTGIVVEATAEATSVRVHVPGSHAPVVVVAGKQIVTAEGVEVLAFPTVEGPPEGAPLRDVVAGTLERGEIAVLPWGFGKWWTRRGELVRELLDAERWAGLFLADTGHRPRWTARPALLARGEEIGVPILTGSDPLPFPGEQDRAGSSCFELEVREAGDAPAAAIVRELLGLTTTPRHHTTGTGLAGFVVRQVAMQARKRRAIR
jgi:hypothetical protein